MSLYRKDDGLYSLAAFVPWFWEQLWERRGLRIFASVLFLGVCLGWPAYMNFFYHAPAERLSLSELLFGILVGLPMLLFIFGTLFFWLAVVSEMIAIQLAELVKKIAPNAPRAAAVSAYYIVYALLFFGGVWYFFEKAKLVL